MDKTFIHYQTAFSIGGFDGPAAPVFEKAQDVFRRWIIRKENARAHRSGNKAYGLTLDVRFTGNSEVRSWVSTCRTEAGDIGGACAWAMEYTHRDDTIEGLSWLNEATLRTVDDGRRIAVRVSIARRVSPELFLREDVKMPPPATPQCVRRLFDSLEGVRLLSGGVDITPPQGRLLRLAETEDDVNRLADDLRSPTRELPFLLLIGASADPSNFAESLAHALVGKAVVCNVPNRPALLEPLRAFKTGFGQCRILFPFHRFGPRLRAHPILPFAKPAEADALRAQAEPLLLAQFTAEEPGALEGPATLSSLLARARIAQLRTEVFRGGNAPVDASRLEEFARELLHENARLGKRQSELEGELRDLRDRLFAMRRSARPEKPEL